MKKITLGLCAVLVLSTALVCEQKAPDEGSGEITISSGARLWYELPTNLVPPAVQTAPAARTETADDSRQNNTTQSTPSTDS